MLRKKDIQDYRGYLPLKWWADDTVHWVGRIIGGDWLDRVYVNPSTGKTHTRYRFGDIQEAQVYLKDGTYYHIPLPVWYLLCEMDAGALDDDCRKWLDGQRAEHASGQSRRVKSAPSGGVLDL